MVGFSEVVDAADKLSVEDLKTLVEILRRRIAERNRADLACDVAVARAEFRAGNTQTSSVDDIMGEVRGES